MATTKSKKSKASTKSAKKPAVKTSAKPQPKKTPSVWERYRKFREELGVLIVDAREAGEHELERGLNRARRECDHDSLAGYLPPEG